MIFQPVLINEQEILIPLRMKVIKSLAKFRQEWQSCRRPKSARCASIRWFDFGRYYRQTRTQRTRKSCCPWA